MSEKHLIRAASFVILEREGKILLMRRFNTGYQDGNYQMPSGHVEVNEYPSEAAIREVREEVGVEIAPEDLVYLHSSYRINNESGGDYIDFFFKATTWTGDVRNIEPQKCDDLVWVSINQLPENTVPVVRKVIEYIHKNKPFSEIGRAK